MTKKEKQSKEPKNTEKILSLAPHIHDKQSIKSIMWLVILALLPAAINSVFVFGLNALFLMLTGMLSSIAAEAFCRYCLKRPITILNGSAVLTGLLLAMNVPPGLPLYIVAIGSFFAIIIVKELFGGLGYNIFNPALAARAFLMASWPVAMTTKWFHFSPKNILSPYISKAVDTISTASIDAITGATPLASLKYLTAEMAKSKVDPGIINEILFSKSMFSGLFYGYCGVFFCETSALFVLLGAFFLMLKKIISWEIPVAYIGSFSIIIFSYYFFTDFPYPEKALLFHVLAGGLILGAFFMATDMVTSPLTRKGMLIFGLGCGLIASIIRLWGGYPEGVSYSILLMNAVVPLIDRWCKPRIFGTA